MLEKCRTNLDFWGLYSMFVEFAHSGLIGSGHGIQNPFVKCKINFVFVLDFDLFMEMCYKYYM